MQAEEEALRERRGPAARARAPGSEPGRRADVPDGGEDDGVALKTVGDDDAGARARPRRVRRGDRVRRDRARPRKRAVPGSRTSCARRRCSSSRSSTTRCAIVTEHGFVPVVTPTLVRERTMEEAGFFPTDRAQVYDVDDGELFLVGTSEVPLSALHRAETFTPDALPTRYAGYSSCFRREAGTYGKDTRGIFRVHQFDKVEMFSFVRARRVARRARAHPRDRGADHRRPRDSVPRRQRRGRRPRPGRGQEVRHRRRGCRRKGSTASSRRARTTPTTRLAGSARA